MANRFLNNITINDEYTLPSADGTADQIITTDGAGQLSFVDQSTIKAGNAEHVVIYAKNTSGVSISKGTPVYITGTVGATDTVEIAPADAGNSAKMPAVGLLDDTLANNAFGYVITGGFMDNITTDPIDGATPNSNDTVYVKSGGGLTLTKPTGSQLIQNIAKVGKVSGGNSGSLIVSSILRTNDVPNLTTGKIWVGSPTYTTESTVVHLDESNGRMGIGTSSPGAKLHVDSSSYGEIAKFGNGNVQLSFGVQSGYCQIDGIIQGTTSRIISLNSGGGNVGIGTTLANKKLTIGGIGVNSTDGLKIEDPTNTAYGAHYSYNDSSTTVEIGGVVSNSLRDCISIARDATRTITIDTSERVGIGTTSPSSKLQVNGDLTVGDDATVGSFINVIAAGSNQDAGIRFGSESNTDSKAAIYTNTSNSDLHFDVTESTRMLIDSGSGNVGIGTTSPSQKLDVVGNAQITSDIHLGRYILHDGDGNTWLGFPSADTISFRTNGSDRIYINSSGNVGIGTTSPDSKLHVKEGDITIEGYNTSRYLRFIEPDGSFQGGYVNYDGASNILKIGVHHANDTNTANDTDAISIPRSSGNVGIGTTNPASQLGSTKVLDISSSGNGEIILDHTDAGVSSDIGLYSWNRNNDHLAHIKASCDGATDSAFISFHAQATGGSFTNAASNERMRITSSGDVGIGTTSPDSILHIKETTPTVEIQADSIYPSSYIDFTNNTGAVASRIYSYSNPGGQGLDLSYESYGTTSNSSKIQLKNAFMYFLTAGSIRATVGNNGNFGIGTTNPGEKLEVNGTVKATASTDAYKGYIKNTITCTPLMKTANTDYNYIPYNSTIFGTTPAYYNRMAAAYDGRVKKIILRHISGVTPTATGMKFKKEVNGIVSTTEYTATVTGGASTSFTAIYNFANSDFTFSEGDSIGILAQTSGGTGGIGGASVQIIVEYNIT